MSRHFTPVEVCERLFGSIEAIGPVIGRHTKTAYTWRRASASRDAGDIPSARHMRSLLSRAAARGIPLTADHLIWGASAEELAALQGPPGDTQAPPSGAAGQVAAE